MLCIEYCSVNKVCFGVFTMPKKWTQGGISESSGAVKGISDSISGSSTSGINPVCELSAAVDDIRNVSSVLSSLNFKEVAVLQFTKEGMKATVEEANCFQGNAFIPASVFQEYKVTVDLISFQVNYASFVTCLNIFGHAKSDSMTALKMNYVGHGSPLVLVVEQTGAVSECSLKTSEAWDVLDFGILPGNYVNKIIMRSEFLNEAWHDLENVRDDLIIFMSPNDPQMKLSCKGSPGSVTISIPKNSEDVEYFDCTETQENTYHMSLLKPTVKVLRISNKISICINERGILYLQYLIRTVSGHMAFVDFICAPVVKEDS